MDGGGLAGAVWPKQSEEFAGRDVEVELFDGRRIAVAFGQPVGVDREGLREIGGVAHHGGDWCSGKEQESADRVSEFNRLRAKA